MGKTTTPDAEIRQITQQDIDIKAILKDGKGKIYRRKDILESILLGQLAVVATYIAANWLGTLTG